MSTNINIEIDKINNLFASYGYELDFTKLSRLYYNDKEHVEGDLLKNVYYNIKLLKYAGFNTEEAVGFLFKHKNFIYENMTMLNLKYAILNKVGLLKSVLKNNPSLLNGINKLNAKRLYALLSYIKVRGQSITLESITSPSLPIEFIDRLTEEYELNDDANQILVRKLESDINKSL